MWLSGTLSPRYSKNGVGSKTIGLHRNDWLIIYFQNLFGLEFEKINNFATSSNNMS